MQRRIRQILAAALAEEAGADAPDERAISVERTRREEHGDFTSNVALTLAKPLRRRPRDIAEQLAGRVGDGGGLLQSVEVAGPGFLNFRLKTEAWYGAFGEIVAAASNWGRSEQSDRPKVLLEYPSPNPTGPLHVGHGRIAALGDTLARVMRFAGVNVATECYINDWGSKIQLFAQSIAARARDQDPPEKGYKGQYVRDIADRAQAASVALDDVDKLGDFGVAAMLDDIERVLEKFRIRIDHYTHERGLYARGDVQRTIEDLRKDGFLEERDGATWFKSKELADDDKNRVVVRSTGEPTYFAADAAYHRDKFARGHEQLVNVLGGDHHGHIPRMRGVIKAMGHDPDAFEVILVQLVTLFRDGQKVAMDKSSGQFVTLEEVLDEVGADAARFFFVSRHHDSTLDFDMELAKKQSMDNPVYYVQYAHARCCAIARRAKELGFDIPPFSQRVARALALDEELSLIKKLADFPHLLREAAAAREPHRVVFYSQEVAQAFQSYYTRLQKVHDDPILPQKRHREGDWRKTWDTDKTHARLLWVEAVRTVLATALGLIGVDAPQRMERSPEEAEDA